MVNKTGVMALLFALVLVAVMMVLPTTMADSNETLPTMAETNKSTPAEMMVTLEVDEIRTEAAVIVSKAEMAESVTVMLTELKRVNENDWELMFPNFGDYLFSNGTYYFSWKYNDSWGIPLKTIAIIPENGTLQDIIFMVVRQPGFYDGSCSTNIPPDLERGNYTIVVLLDYPGMLGTILQIRMYQKVSVFNEEPTEALDSWPMLFNPWLALTQDEEEKLSVSTQLLPARPKSSGFT